jgi:hypothetical protein
MVPSPIIKTFNMARADLHMLRSQVQSEASYHLVEEFLLDMYHLGLEIDDTPALLNSPELNVFLNETAPDLSQVSDALLLYPYSLLSKFQCVWIYDEWKQLCLLRSALQFFLDFYRETILAPVIQAINITELDSMIREWGELEGYLAPSEIDPRIPQSHWWWWAPEPPSSNATN